MQMDCVTTEKRKPRRGKAISPEMADQMVEMYSGGIGIKTIAKELLGRESAKSTVRSLLVRRGVTIREVKDTQDEATKARRYAWRGKDMLFKRVLRDRASKRRMGKWSDLDLFEHAKERNREKDKAEKARRVKELANQKGFRSDYHLKYSTDPAFKARALYKRRFQKIVQGINGIGHGSKRMMALLGCKPREFRSWIESQWEDWMTWDNIGKQEAGKWQIDHVIPCSWFDHSDETQLQICWHYLNLRPLCAVKNRIRGANPSNLIETINALPDHPMKAQMLKFASLHANFYK